MDDHRPTSVLLESAGLGLISQPLFESRCAPMIVLSISDWFLLVDCISPWSRTSNSRSKKQTGAWHAFVTNYTQLPPLTSAEQGHKASHNTRRGVSWAWSSVAHRLLVRIRVQYISIQKVVHVSFHRRFRSSKPTNAYLLQHTWISWILLQTAHSFCGC